MIDRSNDIRRLCEEWIEAAHSGGNGSIAIGGSTEGFRLWRNDILFHEVDLNSIRIAITYLTKTLLLKGYNTIIDFDHKLLWSWLAQVSVGNNISTTLDEYQFNELFASVARCSMVGVRNPQETREEWDRKNQLEKLQEHNSIEMARSSNLLLSYIVFPLLEAICRRACHAYMNEVGEVTMNFSVPRKDGSAHNYKIGRKCSSLRDILFLLESYISSNTLSYLSEMKLHIQWLTESTEHPYDTIFNWRNSSLHGNASHSTIGGTMLGWCYQITLDSYENDYEVKAANALQSAVREAQSYAHSGYKDRRSYYPPV